MSFEGYLDPATTKLSYAELKDKFPDKIKPNAKEYYLNDEEFKEHFKMSFAEYLKMPDWKRPRHKKPLGLF
jgi:hypothetical protein